MSPNLNRCKIVHIIGALVAGGAERFAVDLLGELKIRGLNPMLVALSKRTDGLGRQLTAFLEQRHIEYQVGPTEKVFFNTLGWYAKLMMRQKPDILHLHTPNTELAQFLTKGLFRRPPRVIRTLHSTRPPRKLLMRLALRHNRVAYSIACSNAVKRVYDRFLDRNIICIQNGVRFYWPIRTNTLSLQYKLQLNLSPDKIHYLSVGNFKGDTIRTSPKGHDVLIKAWLSAELGRQQCELHFIGDGSLRRDLQSLAGDDDSIRFHGIRYDVCDWMVAADCFVMPSRWEGLPLAGIEAVGTGLPCIFSELPQLRELNAPLVRWTPINDVDRLAANLKEFKRNGLTPPIEKVREVRQRFSIANTAKEYENLYKTLKNL